MYSFTFTVCPTTTKNGPINKLFGDNAKTTNGFHAPRNVTASRPSSNRWSYVKATIIIGLITICPSTTTGRSLVACIPIISTPLRSWGSLEAHHKHAPSTADWGRLIMGVPYNDPNTPPLELSINPIH